jgi:hypothetical protein
MSVEDALNTGVYDIFISCLLCLFTGIAQFNFFARLRLA